MGKMENGKMKMGENGVMKMGSATISFHYSFTVAIIIKEFHK